MRLCCYVLMRYMRMWLRFLCSNVFHMYVGRFPFFYVFHVHKVYLSMLLCVSWVCGCFYVLLCCKFYVVHFFMCLCVLGAFYEYVVGVSMFLCVKHVLCRSNNFKGKHSIKDLIAYRLVE